MASKIEIGATVTLKSGGPAMTVTNVKESMTVHVAWFDKGHELRVAQLPVESLGVVTAARASR